MRGTWEQGCRAVGCTWLLLGREVGRGGEQGLGIKPKVILLVEEKVLDMLGCTCLVL